MSTPSLGADLRSLDRADRPLFLLAWLLLFFTELGFRLAGLERTKRALSWIGSGPRSRCDPGERDERVQRVAQVVALASGHVLPEPGCVPESLVLWTLLRRQGVASEVRIGVRRHRDRLHAHAWVEHAGEPIGGSGLRAAHYSAFEQPVAGE